MNAIKIAGTIKSIGTLKQITEKFAKAEIVVETNEKYPQSLLVEFPNTTADLLANFGEGDLVEVSVNLRGRKWTNPQGEEKYFMSLSAWAIYPLGEKVPASQEGIPRQVLEDEIGSEEDDDLPF